MTPNAEYTVNQAASQLVMRNNETGHVFRFNEQYWQRLIYKREPRDKPLIDCPTVFFHIDALRYPVFEWTIDLSGAGCVFVRRPDDFIGGCFETCMAGVLLKHPEKQRVWRLTGRRDPDNDEIAYEGRWPD